MGYCSKYYLFIMLEWKFVCGVLEFILAWPSLPAVSFMCKLFFNRLVFHYLLCFRLNVISLAFVPTCDSIRTKCLFYLFYLIVVAPQILVYLSGDHLHWKFVLNEGLSSTNICGVHINASLCTLTVPPQYHVSFKLLTKYLREHHEMFTEMFNRMSLLRIKLAVYVDGQGHMLSQSSGLVSCRSCNNWPNVWDNFIEQHNFQCLKLSRCVQKGQISGSKCKYCFSSQLWRSKCTYWKEFHDYNNIRFQHKKISFRYVL